MKYSPVIDNNTAQFEVLDDDGELDAVSTPREQPHPKRIKMWWILIFAMFICSLVIFTYQRNQIYPPQQITNNVIKKTNHEQDNQMMNQHIQDMEKQEYDKQQQEQSEQVVPMSESESDAISSRDGIYSDPETEQEEDESDFDKVPQLHKPQKVDEFNLQEQYLKKSMQEYYQQKEQEPMNETIVEEVSVCPRKQYMSASTRQCEDCTTNCLKCMHFSQSCFLCDAHFYLNQKGECISECDNTTSSKLLIDDGVIDYTPICITGNHNASFHLSHQSSNYTDYSLPYFIIHPAVDLDSLYHQKYPVVYMFNHDLFNFGHELTINNIIDNAIDNQIIVVILASGTLYDYALYNAFLLQDAQIKIQNTIKARGEYFLTYFGFAENAYGAIRQYQSQFKNNKVQLVIAINPIMLPQYYITYISETMELNLLITTEQHISDYKLNTISGTLSNNTTIVLLNEANQKNIDELCSNMEGSNNFQCFIIDEQTTQKQLLKQGFELVAQFVVNSDL